MESVLFVDRVAMRGVAHCRWRHRWSWRPPLSRQKKYTSSLLALSQCLRTSRCTSSGFSSFLRLWPFHAQKRERKKEEAGTLFFLCSAALRVQPLFHLLSRAGAREKSCRKICRLRAPPGRFCSIRSGCTAGCCHAFLKLLAKP